MSTTALIVEILIVGFLCLATLLPFLIFLPFHVHSITINFFKSVSLLPLLVIAYSLGIIWNRICDEVFEYFDKQIVSSKFESHEAYQTARIFVVIKSENIKNYIEIQRGLVRIARAVAIFSTVYLLITLAVRVSPVLLPLDMSYFFPYIGIIIIVEFFLLFSSFYCWYRLRRGYISAISIANELLEKSPDTSN